jgi:glucan phosphoethanolaminetransferase (alkaline phosphatase superfamily)
MKDKLIRFIQDYKFTLILCLSIFIILFEFAQWLTVPLIFLNISIIILVLVLVSKIKNKLYFVVNFLLVILIAIPISFTILYGSFLGYSNIGSIFETNKQEASEFFNLNVLIIGILSIIIVAFLIFKVSKELKQIQFSAIKVAFFLFAIIFLYDGRAIYYYYQKSMQSEIWRFRIKENFRAQPFHIFYVETAPKIPLIYGTLFGLNLYLYEKFQFALNKNTSKMQPEGVEYSHPSKSIPKIYLVIGESANRNHLSLYGYSVKTTPFLDSLAHNNDGNFSYFDAISAASITRDAFRLALSFATPFNLEPFYKQKNIIHLAKDAGYNTVWISNQKEGSVSDYYPSYVANTSDTVFFEDYLKDDLSLVKYLEDFSKDTRKQFFVINLRGSHFDYAERSDNVDSMYFSTLEFPKNYDANKNELYDRTIHHTDRFLRELYQFTKLHDKESLIFYFSDHGELVDEKGHGILYGGIEQFEIPFLFINNNSSVNINSLVDKYTDKKSGLVNSINCPYIIAEILGYVVEPKKVKEALYDSPYVYAVDGKAYLFDDLKKQT